MKKYILAAVLCVVAGIAYYALSPLFRNTRVDEQLPPAPPSAPATGNHAQSGSPGDSASAAVEGTPGHPASGTVRVVAVGDKQYLRYENFKTINGPDIYVYLSKDLGAKEFINLGAVRATEGNINYEIPDTVNPRDYPYALVWCKTFGVLFNSAKVY